MKYGVIVFPGSNCDKDALFAGSLEGNTAEFIWHKDSSIPSDIDSIIIPGGFSYGDYLRCGAISRFSNIMKEVIKFADSGKPVIGICNGFQILTEANLLPGALLRNKSVSFICKDVYLKVNNSETPFTNQIKQDSVLRIPIAHGEGNYFADDDTIKSLQDNNQIVFQYSDRDGNITVEANPNGAMLNIAGITNEKRNVLGMMPHPERYSDSILGCDDGINVFRSITNFINSN
jgi:phosphoribosylformylglycinamidine synthase subunit PurQ / glutaminase